MTEQEAIERLRYKASGLAPGGVNEQHANDLRALLDSHERMRLALEGLQIDAEDGALSEQEFVVELAVHVLGVVRRALEGKQ